MTDTLSTGTLQGWDLFRPLGADTLFARVLARQGTHPPALLSRPSPLLRKEPGLETLLEGAIQIQKDLLHASLCRPLRVEALEGIPWLVQEGVEGLLLAELSRTPWPLHAASEVGRQLCEALAALYAIPGPNGQPALLIFPELTAANICISRFGDVKLLSPGFSMQEAPVPLLRLVLQQSGERMAPETRRPGSPLGPAVFQYTVGALLLELLSGERFTRILGASSFSPADELEERQKRLPSQLSSQKLLKTHPLRPILEKMLAWEPEQRYPTLEEAGQALLSFAWTQPDAGALEPTFAPGMASTDGDFPTWLDEAFRQHTGEEGTPLAPLTDQAAATDPQQSRLDTSDSAPNLASDGGFRYGSLLEDTEYPSHEATSVGAPGFPEAYGLPHPDAQTITKSETHTNKATLLAGIPSADNGQTNDAFSNDAFSNDALSLPQAVGGARPRSKGSEESTFVNDPLAAPPPKSKQAQQEETGPERTPHAGLWVSGSRGPISADEENTPVKPITPITLGPGPTASPPAEHPMQAAQVRNSGIFETGITGSGGDGNPAASSNALESHPGTLAAGSGPSASAVDGHQPASPRRRLLILGAAVAMVLVVLMGIFSRGKTEAPPGPIQGDTAGLTVGDPYQDQQLEPERASNPALAGRTDEPRAGSVSGAEGADSSARQALDPDAAPQAPAGDSGSDEARIKALLNDDDEGRSLPPEVMKPFRGRVRKGQGNLEITTSPPDALVIVNGDQTFNPPFALEDVPAGQVQLIFRNMELGQRDVVIIDLRPRETFRGTWSFREKRWVMEE